MNNNNSIHNNQNNNKRKIVVFCGPTASGKSGLAIEYALANNGVIINFDSQQVYKDLQIISARPSDEEVNIAPHKLYGFISGVAGAVNFSVSEWCKLAKVEVEACFSEGKVPILVGGTGFYLHAFMRGLSPVPEIPESERVEILKSFEKYSNEELHSKLKIVDLESAESIAIADRYRIMRALEVFDYFGTSISQYKKVAPKPVMDDVFFEVHFIDRTLDILEFNIRKRLRYMLKVGALEEVESLVKKKFPFGAGVMRSIGVSEFSRYLAGEISIDEALDAAVLESRKYAKRQRTWFKKEMANLPTNAVLVEE